MMKYFLDNVLLAVTSAGTPVFYLSVILLLSRFDAAAALFVLWSLLITDAAGFALKMLIAKDRPLPRPRRGILGRYDAGSFPSIHTARISALAVTLNVLITDTMLLFFSVCAVLLVGYSRIYLKHHDWFDVFGGAVIGALIAFSAVSVLR